MASQLRIEGMALRLYRIMSVLLAPDRCLSQTATQPLARGAKVNGQVPLAASPAKMREA
jgi:hypothetical protein